MMFMASDLYTENKLCLNFEIIRQKMSFSLLQNLYHKLLHYVSQGSSMNVKEYLQ